MILNLLLTLWIPCAIINLMVILPVLLHKPSREVLDNKLKKDNVNFKGSTLITHLGLVSALLIAAPLFTYDILFGERK